MPIIGAGLSHKTAPVEVRERLSINEEKLPEALERLSTYDTIAEAVILSTCNRTEIYVVATDLEKGKEQIVNFLSVYHEVPENTFSDCLYFLNERKTVHHLFRVVSSLDSMVVGEAQILGQVKQSYMIAYENGNTGTILNRLFRHALECGKKVRSDTAIGEMPVSVSYAAVQLAKTVFESLEKRPVMVIGAGKMSELTIKHLVSNGASPILVTNRTFKRAKELAEKFCGIAIPFEEKFEKMSEADIVISSTGAPSYIITRDDALNVMRARRFKPIFFIDIAVPRDVEPGIGEIENVFLYDIDDLKAVVDESLRERKQEAEKGEEIVREEVEKFMSWLGSLDVVPTIKELREKMESIREMELSKALSRLSKLDDREKEVVKALASGIINKVLHTPIVKLKEKANEKDVYECVDTIRHLFELDK